MYKQINFEVQMPKHQINCELITGENVSYQMDNDGNWTFTGNPNYRDEKLFSILKEVNNISIAKTYEEYSISDIAGYHEIATYYGGQFHFTGDFINEYFEDMIKDLKAENPHVNYGWFTGNGIYHTISNNNIFDSKGFVIMSL